MRRTAYRIALWLTLSLWAGVLAFALVACASVLATLFGAILGAPERIAWVLGALIASAGVVAVWTALLTQFLGRRA